MGLFNRLWIFRALKFWGLIVLFLALFVSIIYFVSKPNSTQLLEQARQLLAQNQQVEAERVLDRLLWWEAKHPEALWERSLIAYRLAQWEDCLRFLARLDDQQGELSAKARHFEGLAWMYRLEARAAELAWLRCCELDHNYGRRHAVPLLCLLYTTQMRAGDLRQLLRPLVGEPTPAGFVSNPNLFTFPPEAIKSLAPVTIEQQFDEIKYYLSGGIFTGDRAKLTTSQLVRLITKDQSDWQSRLGYAVCLLGDNQFEAALTQARLAWEEQREDSRAAGVYCELLQLNGQFELAAELLRSSATLKSVAAPLWRARGRFAANQGNYELAAQCFQQALRQEPIDLTSLYLLGRCLAQLHYSQPAELCLTHTKGQVSLTRQAAPHLVEMRATDLQQRQQLLHELCHVLIDAGLYRETELIFAFWQQLAPNSPQLTESRVYLAERRQHQTHVAFSADLGSGPPQWQPPVFSAELSAPDRSSNWQAQQSNGSNSSSDSQAKQIWLQEVAEASGLDFRYFAEVGERKYIVDKMGGGTAVGDFDNDGWSDLFFPQGSPIPLEPAFFQPHGKSNQLYRNLAGKRFQNVSLPATIWDRDYSLGATVGDFDNDGTADIFVCNYGVSRLYRNNGDGTFTDISQAAELTIDSMAISAAWADLDRDGDQDLYVVNYVIQTKPCWDDPKSIWPCGPFMFDAQPDYLFRNRGDGTFEDWSQPAGILVPDGKGLGIIVGDVDRDSWPDVYIANDITPNFLFHNQGSAELQLRECGQIAGVALNNAGKAEASMGIAYADLDANGWPDFYCTHFDGETNTLYLNEGNLLFRDATQESGTAKASLPMVSWGTQAVDLDGDGWEELFIPNGHLLYEIPKQRSYRMLPQLFWNRGKARFTELVNVGDYFQRFVIARGASVLDWNRDGWPDIAVGHLDSPPALLENRSAKTNQRVSLTFTGRWSARDGSLVQGWIVIGQQRRWFEIPAGDGYISCNQKCRFIGLAQAERIDQIEILWPSGCRDTWQNLTAGCEWWFVEGKSPIPIPLQPSLYMANPNVGAQTPLEK